MNTMEDINISEMIETGITYATTYGIQFVLALVVLIVGLWIIGKISAGAQSSLEHHLNDITLAKFLSGGLDIVLKVMLVIIVTSLPKVWQMYIKWSLKVKKRLPFWKRALCLVSRHWSAASLAMHQSGCKPMAC